MNVLPRLLYPMAMLPLHITKKLAKEIERDFSKFVWNGKKPRLRRGVAFPNLMYYNWACHSRTINERVHLKGDTEPSEA